MTLEHTGWAWALIGLVIVQRLAELALAKRNTTALLQAGGVEHGRAHYPLFVMLHSAWIAALATWVWMTAPAVNTLLALVFLLLQAGRVWVIITLGRYWTTRIITLPDAPVITGGPFRFVRHPNYLVVCLEIAVLPLALGALEIAIVFSILNAALLAYRITYEDRVLAPRRSGAAGTTAPEQR